MDIDDILQQEKFKDLNNFLDKKMHETAGEDLIKRMVDVLGNEKVARNWFYSEVRALGYQRPYDYCKERRSKEVADILGRIEYGVFS